VALGETFGLKSRCFSGSVRAGNRLHGNMCFKSACNDAGISLTIGTQSYQCTSTGQKINLPGNAGFVTCPNIADFCAQEKASCKDDCNLNGRCLEGNRCYCYPGFSGATCGSVGGLGGIQAA
jgi:EGF-like domain